MKAGTGLVAATLLAGPLLTGCSMNFGGEDSFGARCQRDGPLNSPTLVLMAQAVPTATLVPCVRAIPAGWGPDKLSVANGRAEFALNSDRDGSRALVVVLTKTCDLLGASRVPSDQPGARRYERPTRVSGGYAGSRFYVFPGGCITYRVNLTGGTRVQALTEATGALGFATRSAIRDMVVRNNDGRLKLDPTGSRT